MSITLEKTLAAAPITTRGQPTQLSADGKGERITYAVGLRPSKISHKLQTNRYLSQANLSSSAPSTIPLAPSNTPATQPLRPSRASPPQASTLHPVTSLVQSVSGMQWALRTQRGTITSSLDASMTLPGTATLNVLSLWVMDVKGLVTALLRTQETLWERSADIPRLSTLCRSDNKDL